MTPLRPLAFSLLALAAFYGLWFANDAHLLTGLLVFIMPPLLLAIAAWRGWRRASFTAGVLALLWFCHGVMLAWSEPSQRWMALVEVALALAIIYAACLPGARARREKKSGQAG
ncbi:MAG TPA: DUF2069 domain-containing protein [Thermomonas sp.]|nr:DUF2069 domain-containing protein [Thermomonas sp.]